MRHTTHPQRWTLIAAAATMAFVFTGCSEDSPDDSGDTTPSDNSNGAAVIPDPDARTVSASKLNSALSNSQSVDKQNAAVTLQEKARLPELDDALTGGRDLTQALVGEEGNFTFDIDEDGQDEELYVFIAALDMNTFLAWEKDGRCNLAWEEDSDDTGWLIVGPCDVESEDDVIICNLTDASQSCNICKNDNVDTDEGDEVCQECLVADGDVRCTPESRSNATVDAGNPDGGPVLLGECSPTCMEQPGAVCCMECGCEGAVKCLPECGGFDWDCEASCCFDYDTVACAGASPSNGTTGGTSNGTTGGNTSNGTTGGTSNGTTGGTSNGTTGSTSNGTTGDPGQCNPSCMSQSGAVCCTTCGCEGEVQCVPECGSFSWDCEVGCCFDYDAVECVE